MHRMSPNNPARRRLVFDEIEDERTQDTSDNETLRTLPNNPRRPILEENLKELARTDNSVNILQESIMRDNEEKSIKWNFDFSKEEALFGQYEWYKKEGTEWVIMEPQVNNKCLRYFNENTPFHSRDGSAPMRKKRKSSVDSKSCGSSAKRKIDFD